MPLDIFVVSNTTMYIKIVTFLWKIWNVSLVSCLVSVYLPFFFCGSSISCVCVGIVWVSTTKYIVAHYISPFISWMCGFLVVVVVFINPIRHTGCWKVIFPLRIPWQLFENNWNATSHSCVNSITPFQRNPVSWLPNYTKRVIKKKEQTLSYT